MLEWWHEWKKGKERGERGASYETGDYLLIAILAALVVMCFCVATGCRSTCPPPVVQTQEVLIPQPCVIEISTLPEMSLPPYPPFDAANPKEWALQVEQIARERDAIVMSRIAAMEYQISEHNQLQPKCGGR